MTENNNNNNSSSNTTQRTARNKAMTTPLDQFNSDIARAPGMMIVDNPQYSSTHWDWNGPCAAISMAAMDLGDFEDIADILRGPDRRKEGTPLGIYATELQDHGFVQHDELLQQADDCENVTFAEAARICEAGGLAKVALIADGHTAAVVDGLLIDTGDSRAYIAEHVMLLADDDGRPVLTADIGETGNEFWEVTGCENCNMIIEVCECCPECGQDGFDCDCNDEWNNDDPAEADAAEATQLSIFTVIGSAFDDECETCEKTADKCECCGICGEVICECDYCETHAINYCEDCPACLEEDGEYGKYYDDPTEFCELNHGFSHEDAPEDNRTLFRGIALTSETKHDAMMAYQPGFSVETSARKLSDGYESWSVDASIARKFAKIRTLSPDDNARDGIVFEVRGKMPEGEYYCDSCCVEGVLSTYEHEYRVEARQTWRVTRTYIDEHGWDHVEGEWC